MADQNDQPPPLLDQPEDDEDIFASPQQPEPTKSVPTVDDLFADSPPPAVEEINLDDSLDAGAAPQLQLNDSASGDAPMIAMNGETRASPTPPLPVDVEEKPAVLPEPASIFDDVTPVKEPVHLPPKVEPSAPPMPAPRQSTKTDDDLAEVEAEPDYTIDISISDYQKKGDGMKAYVVYKIVVKNHNVPGLSKSDYEVWRRFSDFLGLYDKLATKHLANGRIVPPPPEKSVVGMTKTKMAKGEEDASASDFLEKRRCTLERFVRRVAQHPALLKDCDFRDFLTLETDLPRASNTAALSSAGVSKFFGRVGETLSKIAYKIDESDRWFEEKQNEVEELDEALKKLHASVEQLVHFRKELSSNTDHFCKGLSMLAACEENTALSRAFSQLAETQEKIGNLHQDQSEKDFYILSEMLKEYISLLHAVKTAFYERTKVWQLGQTAQQELTKKREMKTRYELAGKTDKVPVAKLEVQAAEQKVQNLEEQFEKVTKMLRKELSRFDAQRIRDFKAVYVQYLESLAETQQQLVKNWETFIPEAKAIII